jgi:hypothetical protein
MRTRTDQEDSAVNKWIVGALAGAALLVSSAASAQLVTPERLQELQVQKSQIYKGLTNLHAQAVGEGTAQPIVYTEVGGGDLPVSYYHYRIPRNRLEALAEAIPLLPDFSLAPISILKFSRPDYFISLTVFDSAGEISGLRAEWVTYVVKEGDPKPRVLLLEVQTPDPALNPLNVVSDPADVFEYTRTGDTVTTEIVSGSSSFSSSFVIPSHPGGRILSSGWNAASDILYWTNGVADRQNVNGLISNRLVKWLSGRRVNIQNQTRWAAFVEPRPRWVVLFEERIDAVIQPWVNITDPSVPLDPAFRSRLMSTKAGIFRFNERQRAIGIEAGTAEPVTDFFVFEQPPSVFLNFVIEPDQMEALAAAIPMPEGFALAPLRTVPNGPRQYLLSLNVYDTEGVASGLRAEWSVYVTKQGDPIPRYMILEAQSDAVSLDAVNGFTLPADVFVYEVENDVIRIDVQAPGVSFQATIPLPAEPSRRNTDPEWTEANNLIYWRNGVADKIYYSGLVYDTEMMQVPKETVSITDGTEWAPFIRLDEVLVFENPLNFVASPWNNLDQLEEEIGTP